jgi:hypothetical protein
MQAGTLLNQQETAKTAAVSANATVTTSIATTTFTQFSGQDGKQPQQQQEQLSNFDVHDYLSGFVDEAVADHFLVLPPSSPLPPPLPPPLPVRGNSTGITSGNKLRATVEEDALRAMMVWAAADADKEEKVEHSGAAAGKAEDVHYFGQAVQRQQQQQQQSEASKHEKHEHRCGHAPVLAEMVEAKVAEKLSWLDEREQLKRTIAEQEKAIKSLAADAQVSLIVRSSVISKIWMSDFEVSLLRHSLVL